MASETLARAAAASRSDEVLIALLKISSTDLAQDYFFALNDGDITHNGQLYLRSGFQYKPPATGDTSSHIGSLRIDNVDTQLSQAIKGISSKIYADLIEVLASAPDTVETAFPQFEFFNIGWDIFAMEGSLGLPDDSDEPCVSFKYTPSEAPGLYAG